MSFIEKDNSAKELDSKACGYMLDDRYGFIRTMVAILTQILQDLDGVTLVILEDYVKVVDKSE